MKKLFFALVFLITQYSILNTCFGQANTYFHDRIDTTIYATTTGTNTYTATNLDPNFNVARYVRGLTVNTFIVNGNTGAATFRLVTKSGTLSTAAIRKAGGSALTSGDIPDSSAITLIYYGNFWRLVGVHGMGSAAWMLLGNAGTTAGTNFLGTTDNVTLQIKTNATERAEFRNDGAVHFGTHAVTPVATIFGLFSSSASGIELAAINSRTGTTQVNGIFSQVTGTNNQNYSFNGVATGGTRNFIYRGIEGDILTSAGNWYNYDSTGAPSYWRGSQGIGTISPLSPLHVNGAARFGLASTTTGSHIWQNSTNANTLTISSGVTSSSYSLVWPTAQGAANSFLMNNGSGTLTWNTGSGLFWSLTGNAGTTAGTNFLGTTDAQDVVFKRNSAEVMRLYSASNFVGIGTAAPSTELEVNGTITTAPSPNFTGVINFYNASTNPVTFGLWRMIVDASPNSLVWQDNGTTRMQIIKNGGTYGLGLYAAEPYFQLTNTNAGNENWQMGVNVDGVIGASKFGFRNSGAAGVTFVLANDGRVYGTALHNNAAAVTGTTNQYIASGTYTATLTNVTNVAASTAYRAQWIRTGNVVTVSGKVDIDATLAAGTASELGMSLPIASDITAEEGCAGGAVSDVNVAGLPALGARVKGDAANNRAAITFNSLSLSNDAYSFTFTYLIQ